MKSIIFSILLSLVIVASSARAGDLREIELKDGTVITGEVVSLSGGMFTIKSDSLGTIRMEESKVRAIRMKPAAGTPAPAGKTGASGEVRSLQEKMMSDREIMAMIESLKDDQEFKKLLEDPAVLKAVETGDVAALMKDPRFMNLLNNPTVKEIEKKVK